MGVTMGRVVCAGFMLLSLLLAPSFEASSFGVPTGESGASLAGAPSKIPTKRWSGNPVFPGSCAAARVKLRSRATAINASRSL